MPNSALWWVIERDDGTVMEQFVFQHEARNRFATDLYDRSEYRVAQRWMPAVPVPFWCGWRQRKARCECGVLFRSLSAYQGHWIAQHGQDNHVSD